MGQLMRLMFWWVIGSGFLVCLFVARPAAALDLEFVADSEEHQAAVAEYRGVWREEGPAIVEALGEGTGVFLSENRIPVVVWEGISRSGNAETPMYLRASYSASTKRATLVHELAHRYLVELDSDTVYSDIHYPLSLLLYEVWSELWGEEFARGQAKVEAERAKRYRQAWDWVLSLSKEERATRWKEYLQGSNVQPTPPG